MPLAWKTSLSKDWKAYCVIMVQCGGLRKERKIFNVKQKIGEKTKGLGNQKKKHRNKRNKLKWTLVWIKINKFLKTNKLQIRNRTREGTRTCTYGTIIYRNFVWLLILVVIRRLVGNIVGWLIWFRYKEKSKQALDILHLSKSLIAWTFFNLISLMEMTQWTKYWIQQKFFCLPFVLVYYWLMLHRTIFFYFVHVR